MSGGGGNGTSQEVLGNWSDPMSFYWNNPQHGFLGRARLESEKGYVPYTGERVAGMTDDQTTAIDYAGDVARGGTNLANAGRDQVFRTSNGDYLKNSQGQAYNPFDTGIVPLDRQDGAGAYNQWSSYNPAAKDQFVADKYNAKQLTAGSNAYAGMDSPYYQSLINKGAKDITKAYQQGTQANTTKMMNMAGIFGGGAHVAAEKNNQEALATSLGDYMANMGNTQYDRSANLAESDIGRKLGADQYNIGTDAASYGDWANRKGAASAGDIGRESDYFDRYLNRDLGAQGSNYGTQSGLWNSERGRQSQSGQFGSGNDLTAMQIYKDLYGFGEKEQGQNQRVDDVNYQNWQDQQGWNKNQLNWLGNAYSQAQGTTGSQTVQNYGGGSSVNPFSAALGGGMFGRGMGWW